MWFRKQAHISADRVRSMLVRYNRHAISTAPGVIDRFLDGITEHHSQSLAAVHFALLAHVFLNPKTEAAVDTMLEDLRYAASLRPAWAPPLAEWRPEHVLKLDAYRFDRAWIPMAENRWMLAEFPKSRKLKPAIAFHGSGLSATGTKHLGQKVTYASSFAPELDKRTLRMEAAGIRLIAGRLMGRKVGIAMRNQLRADADVMRTWNTPQGEAALSLSTESPHPREPVEARISARFTAADTGKSS